MPKSNPDLLTQAEYSRWRGERGLPGSSREAVRRAVDEQRISTHGPDRLIDPGQADVEWARNTRARLSPSSGTPAAAATSVLPAHQLAFTDSPASAGQMPACEVVKVAVALEANPGQAYAVEIGARTPAAPETSVAAAAVGGAVTNVPGAVTNVPGAAGGTHNPDDHSYAASRARRERADAEAAEIEVAKLRGTLVARDDVDRGAFVAGRELRDALESSINALAAELAPIDNADRIAQILRRHNRTVLDLVVALLREKVGPSASASVRAAVQPLPSTDATGQGSTCAP